MATFEKAIPRILLHEGGYVNNPSDPGGHTNYGITLGLIQDLHLDLNHDGTINYVDIKGMSVEDAKSIYRRQWWDKYQYGTINDQTLATKVFDFSVNMGSSRAHKLLQQAINSVTGGCLVVDGILGSSTFRVINEALKTPEQQQKVLDAYSNAVWAFYTSLAEKNPKLKTFLRGWRNRAYDIDRAGEIN